MYTYAHTLTHILSLSLSLSLSHAHTHTHTHTHTHRILMLQPGLVDTWLSWMRRMSRALWGTCSHVSGPVSWLKLRNFVWSVARHGGQPHWRDGSCTMIQTMERVRIPYSLKFSRVKIFMDFTGQRTATNFFFSVKFQVHNRCKTWLEIRPRKFYPQRFAFAEFGKSTKYLMKILGYTVRYKRLMLLC